MFVQGAAQGCAAGAAVGHDDEAFGHCSEHGGQMTPAATALGGRTHVLRSVGLDPVRSIHWAWRCAAMPWAQAGWLERRLHGKDQYGVAFFRVAAHCQM